MTRLVFALLLAFVMIAFAISNSHHVELSLIVGAPIKIRLVFLMSVAFTVGMVAPIFLQLFRRVREQKKARPALPRTRVHELGPEDGVLVHQFAHEERTA